MIPPIANATVGNAKKGKEINIILGGDGVGKPLAVTIDCASCYEFRLIETLIEKRKVTRTPKRPMYDHANASGLETISSGSSIEKHRANEVARSDNGAGYVNPPPKSKP